MTFNELNNSKCDELLAYCRGNNRVCPRPQEWNKVWDLLPNKKRLGLGWNPPPPLILAAWHETSDYQKRQRFEQHIRWAYEHGAFAKVTKTIYDLREGQWHHTDD